MTAASQFLYKPDTVSVACLYETANFFTIDNLAGTKAGSFTDVVLSNEPPLTASNALKQGPGVMAVAAATVAAFKLADSNPGIRQLYQISELGPSSHPIIVTPKWMHLQASTKLSKEFSDFRNDLSISNFDGPLKFDIRVSSVSQDRTRKIGEIVITESVASESCDHRLHFNHPKWRDDLVY